MALKFINTFEIEPTNYCNAKCVFCPRDALTRPKGYMSWETFKKIVNKAIELRVKKIGFVGLGEPFLHKDLIEYLSYLNQYAPEIEINVTSNGELITPKIAAALNALNIAELVISFNGYDKISYEQAMVRLSFDRVMTNLKYIAEHADNLRTKIRFIPVLTKTFNVPEYKKMKELLLGVGFKDASFPGYYPCINRAGYFNDPDVTDANTAPAQPLPPYPTDNLVCTRFLNSLQINWNGDIELCCNDINNEASLGNISTSSNEEIEQKILYFRNPGTKPPICRRCNDPVLRGGFKYLE